MEFESPDAADIANVCCLNQRFLGHMRAAGLGRDEQQPATAAAGLSRLDVQRQRHLAESPFLLFSLAENDSERWKPVFERRPVANLLLPLDAPGASEVRIVTTALGFLWQLAKRRPYAARVVSGASYVWCEQLALCTLVDLFEFAAVTPALLAPRLTHNAPFWHKLLSAGTSDEEDVRTAAKLAALQTVLTADSHDSRERLPAAACSMPPPAMRVAERTAVSKRQTRGYNTPPDESALDKEPD